MPKSARPFTVVVEGNIGSGKTTFLNHFEKFPGVLSMAEPVNMWRNAKGHNLLVLQPFQ
jgi:deoxynucleoside kinase